MQFNDRPFCTTRPYQARRKDDLCRISSPAATILQDMTRAISSLELNGPKETAPSDDSAFLTSPVPISPQPDRFGDLAPFNNHTSTDPESLSYLIISGGTGANSIASAFGHSPAFVLPVSDDGGSSAEILRCFGGPSIGDIRAFTICSLLLC